MALLGVLLAFASAKVGGERTELVKTMVEQQTAHAAIVVRTGYRRETNRTANARAQSASRTHAVRRFMHSYAG